MVAISNKKRRAWTQPDRRGVIKVVSTHGGATSAACVMGASGVRIKPESVWIPGEGWVRWTELYAQVDQAHREWRARCAIQGRLVRDGAERIAGEIAERIGLRG